MRDRAYPEFLSLASTCSPERLRGFAKWALLLIPLGHCLPSRRLPRLMVAKLHDARSKAWRHEQNAPYKQEGCTYSQQVVEEDALPQLLERRSNQHSGRWRTLPFIRSKRRPIPVLESRLLLVQRIHTDGTFEQLSIRGRLRSDRNAQPSVDVADSQLAEITGVDGEQRGFTSRKHPFQAVRK